MTSAVPIARFRGVEVRAHWSWVLALAFVTVWLGSEQPATPADWSPAFGWITAAVVAALVFVSVAVHELAHVAVARRNGVGGNVVVVHLLGGAYVLEARPRTPGQEFRLAIAGPALSIVLAGIFLAVAYVLPNEPAAAYALAFAATWLFVFNLFLSLVNLLPSYPMDGGRIVRSIVWRRTGRERDATASAGRVGRFLGLGLVMAAIAVVLFTADLGGALALGLAGWLLIAGGGAVGRRAFVENLVTGLTVSDAIDPAPARIPPQLTLDTFADEYLEGPMGGAVLVERDGRIVGVIGSGQLRRLGRRNWPKTRAEQAMTPIARVPVVADGSPLWPALEQLERTGLDAMLVADGAEEPRLLTRRAAAQAVHRRALDAAKAGAAAAAVAAVIGQAGTAAGPGATDESVDAALHERGYGASDTRRDDRRSPGDGTDDDTHRDEDERR